VSAMPKSVVPPEPRLLFGKLGVDDLDALMAIENDVYPFPWTRGNFLDSLYNGYEAWVMRDDDGALLGYFLLMLALDEAHLLNISLRRDLHGKGLGRTLLDKAVAVARDKGAVTMFLEVRPSNQRALQVYERYGFLQVGRRKGYYPANANAREDAIVMRLEL
jgi:[ribosomal protein S18]-alanine N-acetyltransferase